jgi:hypothetical protein
MHKDATHTTPQLCHSKCMGMLLEWHARNMRLRIAFMHGVHGFGNFVWEASNTRSFSHAHATRKIHQHDTTQVDNLSNSVDVKLRITQLICIQNTHSVMSGKMKMVDFGLILHPQHTRTYPQHNTTSSTHIHKKDQCKSYMVDNTCM